MNLFHSRAQATLDAFSHSFAVIEFSPDGTVLNVNDNFCQALGYEPKEIVGKHHRLFVGEKVASSSGYNQFWSDLAKGKPNAGEFRRFGKSGQPVWIQASYCPVKGRNGSVISIVKLAADVTRAKLQSAENQSVLDAVSRSQGIGLPLIAIPGIKLESGR
jgi:methyl-accepting chemotaxis protein